MFFQNPGSSSLGNSSNDGNGPSKKRARRDVEQESSEVKADDEFWLEDGNLILIAKNVKFRVYRGILTAHSSVFADMLALPQPPNDPSGDASNASPCPLIHLQDHPEDLRYVFDLLMPRSSTAKYVNLTCP